MSTKNLVTFIVDDKKFIVSIDTLNLYPTSLLTKVVTQNVSDKYIKPSNKIDEDSVIYYVDRDPLSFKYIVDYLRGYDLDLEENKQLHDKITFDLKYFGLPLIIQNINIETNDISDILKEEYDEQAPLLKQFINHLENSKEEDNKEDNKLADIMEQINQNGGQIPFSLITTMSNDENIKKLVKEQQYYDDEELSDLSSKNFSESDSESECNVLHKTKRIYIEID